MLHIAQIADLGKVCVFVDFNEAGQLITVSFPDLVGFSCECHWSA